MSRITESARGEDCTVRLGGICNHNSETVVLAHLNGIRFGHGTAQKVNDLFACYACSACHDAIDRRTHTNLDKSFVKLAHMEAVIETQMKLIEKGLIKHG